MRERRNSDLKRRNAVSTCSWPPSAFCLLLSAFCLLPSLPCLAQQPAEAAPAPEEEEQLLPGDWAVQLLDALERSPNREAGDALYRAAAAAGPAIIPQLEEALKDDRTAEFAAQALAYIGGEKAIQILWKLQSDPRDLNLRRFYYGALGEYDAPEAVATLLEVINRADDEPDRTVTEAAILALTVRSDPKLLRPLREAIGKIKDVVIRLDLENAGEVIERRAKYLASPQAKQAGGSLETAVRTYFMPALESSPPAAVPKPPARRATPAKSAAATTTPKPAVNVQIQQLTLSPDKTRALARVIFEDPTATAYYDIVLQKRYGDWAVASVWLGPEVEKPPVVPPAAQAVPE
jgi:HEAT repeat protein